MRNRVLPAIALLALTGCPNTVQKLPTAEAITFGSDGHKLFRYADFKGCGSDCLLDKNPIASSGAATELELIDATTQASRPFPAIVGTDSSAPSVATFSLVDNQHVMAMPGAAGSTELTLSDSFGNEIDRVKINVADAATIDVVKGWTGDGPQIAEMAQAALDTIGQDASGDQLVGLLPEVTATGPITQVASSDAMNHLVLRGPAGAGILTLASGSAKLDLPYQIVAAAMVTAVAMPPTETVVADGGANALDLSLSTASGPIYGDACAWQISDPALSLNPVIASLSSAPAAIAELFATHAGHFTATCTAGSATATLTVTAN